MRTIGIVTEMLANVIEMLKQLPTMIILICYYVYKPAEHFPSNLSRFLECWKCNML